MPELPEVESVKTSLLPYLKGQKVKSVKVWYPKLVSGKGTKRDADPLKVEEFEKELEGEEFKGITRRAKNLIIEFVSGKALLIHLKMTGQLVYKEYRKGGDIAKGGHPIQENEFPNKHTYITFELEKGQLLYNDVRMFGYVLYFPTVAEIMAGGHFDGLGLEPYDPVFTEEYFVKEMQKRRGVLKRVLMSQEVVVGLGNIYCDEACFDAGVRPDRAANDLSEEELKRLYASVRRILELAIEMGGSSVNDYLLGDGSKGNYANYLKVYMRGGKSCVNCGGELEKFKLNGRTTVVCEECQK